MDFSKFSDGEFEVKEWVNGALGAHGDTQTPLDVCDRIYRHAVVLHRRCCTNSADIILLLHGLCYWYVVCWSACCW